MRAGSHRNDPVSVLLFNVKRNRPDDASAIISRNRKLSLQVHNFRLQDFAMFWKPYGLARQHTELITERRERRRREFIGRCQRAPAIGIV